MAKPSNYDEVMDAKTRKKQQAAYDAADSTPPSPILSGSGDYEDINPTEFENSAGATTEVNLRTEKPGRASRYVGPNASKAGAGQGMRGVKTYAKGGSASSRADGIAQRGKTRGTIIMCGGGKA